MQGTIVCAPPMTVTVTFREDAVASLADVDPELISTPDADPASYLAGLQAHLTSERVGLAVAQGRDGTLALACGTYQGNVFRRLTRLAVRPELDAAPLIRELSRALEQTPWAGTSPGSVGPGRERHVDQACADLARLEPASGEGAWLTDARGYQYLDAEAGFRGLDLGHRHPALVRAARLHQGRVVRDAAPEPSALRVFAARLARACGTQVALPVTTADEALSVAMTLACLRASAQDGVPEADAHVVSAGSLGLPPGKGLLHGRPARLVTSVRWGDLDAVREALRPHTVAVLVPPLRAHDGLALPDEGYLPGIRALCDAHHVLMVSDETETGIARTGVGLTSMPEGITPDLTVLGPALGGGLAPLAAVTGNRAVVHAAGAGWVTRLMTADPAACTVGAALLSTVSGHDLPWCVRELSYVLGSEAYTLPGLEDLRLRGLWAALDLDPQVIRTEELRGELAVRGVLARTVGRSTLCLAPPLTITHRELHFLMAQVRDVLECAGGRG